MKNVSSYYKSPQGVTLRKDQQALFGFLPKEGFAFFGPADEFENVQMALDTNDWAKLPVGFERLKGDSLEPFPPLRERSLGSLQHHWKTIPTGEYPLIINWMLTGKCNYRCTYCYAQDIMQRQYSEAVAGHLRNIIKTIESLCPIAVVVTGGEPTISPNFVEAIMSLSKFTSVVVDTNATLLTDEHIDAMAKAKAHVRVSLDSHRPQINRKTRIPLTKELSSQDLNIIFNNLEKLRRFKIPATVNTVASTSNYDDIKSLEHVLHKFNITKMRVRLVEDSMCIGNYIQLIGDKKRNRRFIDFTSRELRGSEVIPIYCSFGRVRNSIVLVSPNGEYYTESLIKGEGKILIDEISPTEPTLESLHKNVDFHAHSSRYLVI